MSLNIVSCKNSEVFFRGLISLLGYFFSFYPQVSRFQIGT